MVLAIEQCHKQGFIHRDIKPDVGSPNLEKMDLNIKPALRTFCSTLMDISN